MKLLLFLTAFAVATATAGAQELNPDVKKRIEKYNLKERTVLPQTELKTLAPALALDEWQKLPPGVYKLPQDGMPCLVPDTKDIAAMPNAMPQQPAVQAGKIPNAAERHRLEQLKGKLNNLKVEPSR